MLTSIIRLIVRALVGARRGQIAGTGAEPGHVKNEGLQQSLAPT